MKGKIALSIGVVTLLLFVSLPAGFSAAKKAEPVTPPDWAALDVKSWDETFYNLVPPPTENGNAMAYFLEAIHFGFDSKTKLEYPWWDKFGGDDIFKDEPDKKAILAEAIKIPELDLLVKGSLQKDYRWVSVFAPPSTKPGINFFEMKMPRYIDIIKLSKILAARGLDKLAKGDKAGGEADMIAAIRMGHIMEKDVTVIGMMVGIANQLSAAKRMPDFYRKAGDEAKTKAWEEFIPLIEKRRDAIKNFMRYFSSAPSVAEAEKIVGNRSLPPSIRLETITQVIADTFFKSPRAMIIGLPDDVKKLVTGEYFDDPEMVIVQLKMIEDIYAGDLSSLRNRLKLERQVHE